LGIWYAAPFQSTSITSSPSTTYGPFWRTLIVTIGDFLLWAGTRGAQHAPSERWLEDQEILDGVKVPDPFVDRFDRLVMLPVPLPGEPKKRGNENANLNSVHVHVPAGDSKACYALSHRDHAFSFWMNVARAEPGDWTCWLSLAHIPMRSQTTTAASSSTSSSRYHVINDAGSA
jgi:hypothetical protein